MKKARQVLERSPFDSSPDTPVQWHPVRTVGAGAAKGGEADRVQVTVTDPNMTPSTIRTRWALGKALGLLGNPAISPMVVVVFFYSMPISVFDLMAGDRVMLLFPLNVLGFAYIYAGATGLGPFAWKPWQIAGMRAFEMAATPGQDPAAAFWYQAAERAASGAIEHGSVEHRQLWEHLTQLPH